MSTQPKPVKTLRLLSSTDAALNQDNVWVAGKTVLGYIGSQYGKYVARPTGRTRDEFWRDTLDQAVAALVACVNVRKIRSTLTARGIKAPSGVYGGVEVVHTSDDAVVVRHRSAGFGGVTANPTRVRLVREAQEILAVLGVETVCKTAGADRWGEAEYLVVGAR